jgi:hypothetical protein
MASHLALLRVVDPATSAYIARLVGERERVRSPGGQASERTNATPQVVKAASVMPEEFSGLPLPTETTFPGFFYSPQFGVWRHDVLFPPVLRVTGAFESRAASEQHLEPWTQVDLDRLGLSREEDLPAEQEEAPPGGQTGEDQGSVNKPKRPFRYTKGGTSLALEPKQE